jgi:hypothetical protein
MAVINAIGTQGHIYSAGACDPGHNDNATIGWGVIPDYVPPIGAVGGLADRSEVAGAPLQTGGSSGISAGLLAAAGAALVAGALALGGAAWRAKRKAPLFHRPER